MAKLQDPVAVTLGEPAGIGPDLTIIAWVNRKRLQLPCFYVRGDEALLKSRAAALGMSLPVTQCNPEDAPNHFGRTLPLVQTGESLQDTPGAETPDSAASVIASIEQCVADVQAGKATAVVTNPINKAALFKAGFPHPGHTEFLGKLGAQYWPEQTSRPVMMIAGPELMVVPVTVHIPISKVPEALTTAAIVETAKIVTSDLKSRFGFPNPRLAVCGLNPHAGENGTMGSEDNDIIAPAIKELASLGIDATGPHPADTLFHPRARQTYDCVLGMYHDQVLVPAKTIGFDDSVNITLGLPFIRTSPDHGTAYSLAGTGNVRVDSFAASIRMAHALAHPETL